MKKFAALFLSCLMTASVFTACGDSDGGGSNSSKHEKIVEKWADAAITPKGAEDYFTCTFPDEYIDTLKDKGEWDNMVQDYNDDIQADLDNGYSYKIDEVKMGGELTEDELKSAEGFFFDLYDAETTVKAGFWYDVKATRTKDGDDDTQAQEVAAVELENDGWKIIPFDHDSLSYYSDKSSEDTSED